jgi:hypothetical protein
MKRWGAALLIVAVCAASACGRKKRTGESHGQESPAAAAVPTPDTTPIEALRTPAGLALKTGGTPVPVTPSPSVSPASQPKAGS